MPQGGWDIRNLLEGSNLALLLLYVGVLILTGALAFSFKGSVVV